ncbi:hypothetical protein CTAYLR_009663 [Chrysophaeum taylorii]|uniref:Uncharacterized protein n=1 Tax=Chrysophaeum taylorii TaxID=2483200 RepID=A0AAD7UKT9_9STRA|nr:hypothetical protein CTAYLR_009663 [Chrysophaeum taylorii]
MSEKAEEALVSGTLGVGSSGGGGGPVGSPAPPPPLGLDGAPVVTDDKTTTSPREGAAMEIDSETAVRVVPLGEAAAVVKASFGAPDLGAPAAPPPTPEGITGDADDEVGAPAPDSTGKRRRRGWTEEEEKRLREGVAQHGAGQWAKIRDSYGFKSENEGEGRTCVNLKDKWRNLNRPPRPEKPAKAEQVLRPPRKKKPRTPKRKRDARDATPAHSPTSDTVEADAIESPAPPPAWIPAAAAWCKANLVRVDKGKVHVGALRTKFANSAEFFPGKEFFGDDESELENIKYDLENPKTEASKKFRSDALEPFVGADAIRQNCFIGGLNQLGVFGWAVKGEEASPPARAPLAKADDDAIKKDDMHPADVASVVSAATKQLTESGDIRVAGVVPATLGAVSDVPPTVQVPVISEPPVADVAMAAATAAAAAADKDDAPPKKRKRKAAKDVAADDAQDDQQDEVAPKDLDDDDVAGGPDALKQQQQQQQQQQSGNTFVSRVIQGAAAFLGRSDVASEQLASPPQQVPSEPIAHHA